METILHIGMPRTGTTSLQRSLADHRNLLMHYRVLYPGMGKSSGSGHAHHLLTPLLAPEKLWGRVKTVLGADPLAGAQQRWDFVRKQIDRSKPERLLLSSEGMFDVFPKHGLERFGQLLKGVSDRITVVAYVRDPAGYYDSMLLEQAKRMLLPRRAGPIAYRKPIEQFRRAFGADLKVRTFTPELLKRGELAADFLHNVLDLDIVPSEESGASPAMRPEAAAVFQQYMNAKTGEPKWTFSGNERDLVETLIEIAREIGGPETALRSDVAEAITNSSTDLLWLRDEFDIVFDHIDYSRIAASPPKSRPEVGSLRDAYDFNKQIHAAIVAEAKAKVPQIAPFLPEALS